MEFLCLLILFVALLCFLAYRALHKRDDAGKEGERMVRKILRKLPRKKYRLLNDIMLKTHGGNISMTQIDHVVISVYGIFVVETKNYKGWIFGSEKSAHWQQNIYGHRYQSVNPAKQNYGHILALAYVLEQDGWNNVPLYSVVAYSDNADLHVTTSQAAVVNFSQLLATIKQMSCDECMTLQQVKEIRKLFKKKDINSFWHRYKHKREIKKMLKSGLPR